MNGWESVAEAQYGVITRAQMREAGLSNRRIHALVTNGRLQRVHPAVFRVTGSYPSARQRAAAAVLWCGNDALLSFATAASLLQLPLRRASELHVSVPRGVKRLHDGLVVHRTDIGSRDRFRVDGLACTSPSRTIIDLAAALEGEELEHVFDRARKLGLVTPAVFTKRCNELCTHGRTGASALRGLLHVIDRRPKESRLEVRTARLLRRHALEPDATQYEVAGYRLDFAWIRRMLAVECDGFEWHGSRLAWKRDRRRVAALESLGWRLVHVTWEDVDERPDETVSRIRVACTT